MVLRRCGGIPRIATADYLIGPDRSGWLQSRSHAYTSFLIASGENRRLQLWLSCTNSILRLHGLRMLFRRQLALLPGLRGLAETVGFEPTWVRQHPTCLEGSPFRPHRHVSNRSIRKVVDRTGIKPVGGRVGTPPRHQARPTRQKKRATRIHSSSSVSFSFASVSAVFANEGRLISYS